MWEHRNDPPVPKRTRRRGAATLGALQNAPSDGAARLDVRLFGHFDLSLGGERLTRQTPRKTRQLLAYLLLHRGNAVSREYLAFLLYPDDEEPSARAKLRATLADLPKVLPPPLDRYVTVESDMVAWNARADVWIDVEAFSQAASDRTRLAEAIGLYRGDLLPEVYDEWLDVIRERYRSDYVRCLSDLVSESRRNANLNLAIEVARKILAIDPLREDVVRRLIAMRYESGDRAGALGEYAAFAKRLAKELGIEPMPETVAVAEGIARGQHPGDGGDESDRVVLPAPAVLPFVGRREEMDRLLQAWNRAARGRGQSAFVGGETGIGKSRLVHEFANAVEERGGRVLLGTTGSPEAVPYDGVVDALRSALPLVASLKPSIALAGVASLVPEIHARVALPALPRLDAQSERVRLFESIFRCIADLAASRPLLLIVEDMHSAQAASIELMRFLLHRIAGAAVMIVVTYRDEETPRLHALHRLRREARTASGGSNLWLSGLSVADVDQALAALPEMRPRNAAGLVAASQGNPLFLTQLAVEARDGETASAPASLQEAVRRRIDRLGGGARTVAEIAACIGDRFSRDAVREVSAWEEASLTEALDELLDRRIIREAGGRGVLEYVFTHNLVQDEIARTVPAKDAAIRRRRIARVLEELYPERFSELSATLAAHYECAGDQVNAARCYAESVRRSISIGALEEARTACERALALELPLRARVELLLERITIASRDGRGEERSAALRELERCDRELGDPLVHLEVLRHRVEYAVTIGDRAMEESAVAALRAAAPPGDLRWNATASLAQAKMHLARGALAEAFACAEAALHYSRTAGDDAGVAAALCVLARVDGFRGNLSSAVAFYEEAASVAARAADPALELLALGSGWVVAYQSRDLKRCRSIGERSADLAASLGDRPAEAQALGRLGVALLAFDADIAEARARFDAATRIHEESGDPVGAAAQLLNRSVLEAKLGFFDRASHAALKATALFERSGDERGRIGAVSNLVYIKACQNDAPGARKAASAALDDARKHGFGLLEASILENLAFAEGAVGNFRRAIELAEASFAARSRSQSLVWSAKTLADAAIWYLNLGDNDSALESVRRLLADEDAIARGADWPAYCYWAAAQVLRSTGDSAAARRALERARGILAASARSLEPEDRASFLALPFHRDIERAAATGDWPDPPR